MYCVLVVGGKITVLTGFLKYLPKDMALLVQKKKFKIRFQLFFNEKKEVKMAFVHKADGGGG